MMSLSDGVPPKIKILFGVRQQKRLGTAALVFEF